MNHDIVQRAKEIRQRDMADNIERDLHIALATDADKKRCFAIDDDGERKFYVPRPD